MTPCRHCGVPASFHVRLPEGCYVFPDDREQWLCWQHYDRLDNDHELIGVAS